MLVLLGSTRDSKILAELHARKWGRIWVEDRPTPADEEPWALDNGAFVDYLHGRPFDGDRFRCRLERARAMVARPPVFAVTPDIVAGGGASLEFSLGWRERIGEDGWRWYLVVQDGMLEADVRESLPHFDGVFLGGSTRFKSSVARWRALTAELGLPLHYGRASTPERVRVAHAVGVDSLDSSFPLWRRDRLDEFIRACEGDFTQGALWPVAPPHAGVNLIGDGW